VETNLYALSEPLFTLLLLGCTWSLARLQATGRERYVIAAGLTAGLGTLCRYVGGIALVAGAILLLMERREGRARLGNLLRFAVLGSLPIAFWCLRNYLVTGRPVGLRRVGVLTFPEALESMRRTAVGLFIPDVFPETLAFAIVVGFAVLAATLIARAHRPSGRTPVPLSPFVVMMACYLSAVAVLSTWIVGTFPNSSRSLAPIVPIFGIVLACLLFEAFGSLSWHSSRPRALVALGALALPLVAVPAAISARLVLYHKLSLDGAGYHAAKWRRSDLIVAIKERRGPFAAGPAIFSNEPEAIHTLAGGRVYSVRGVWEAAFERPDELHRAATRAPSVLALMHSDESEAGRWTDAALENSGLFARAARFEGGCVYVPVPATDRRTALARD
jgi:hypothetical protein